MSSLTFIYVNYSPNKGMTGRLVPVCDHRNWEWQFWRSMPFMQRTIPCIQYCLKTLKHARTRTYTYTCIHLRTCTHTYIRTYTYTYVRYLCLWYGLDAREDKQNRSIVISIPQVVKTAHRIIEQHDSNCSHWGRSNMDAISQTTFPNAFSSMKCLNFDKKNHLGLFLRFDNTSTLI